MVGRHFFLCDPNTSLTAAQLDGSGEIASLAKGPFLACVILIARTQVNAIDEFGFQFRPPRKDGADAWLCDHARFSLHRCTPVAGQLSRRREL